MIINSSFLIDLSNMTKYVLPFLHAIQPFYDLVQSVPPIFAVVALIAVVDEEFLVALADYK